jgi:TonB-dependent starch-binding outer membrane protein SusC
MKIKVNFKSLVLLAFFTALSSFAFAQKTISGLVTDGETNEPLVGASIVVTGTTKGTLTDVDGKYTLSDVPKEATSLTYSFTGYASLTIPIGSSSTIDAKLKGGSILEEMVVVGYGSVRKVDATGAVNSVTEKDFNKGINTSVEQLMQGRVAGVSITQNGGSPGGGINVRIRGTSSVRNGNNPLFVVDGVPLSGGDVSPAGTGGAFDRTAAKNPLNFLNPNDIEKIDILKDASATAIYGARGANGVVLVTTKKGKGKGTLDFNYSLGISQLTKKYDLLSASAFKSAYTAVSGGASADLGGNTDWQDVMFRKALSHDNVLSYGGGTDKGNYRFSLGYLNQQGIVLKSGMQRTNARFNGNQSFLDNRLNLSVNLSVAQVHDDDVAITENVGFYGDLLGNILKSNPTASIYAYNKSTKIDCDTCTVFQFSDTEPTPAAISKYTKDFTNTLKTLGNISADFKIIDGLTFKTVLGFDKSTSARNQATSKDLQVQNNQGGRLFVNNIGINNALMENYFNYNKTFGSVNFTGLLGYSYQSFKADGNSFQYRNFRTSDVDQMINNNGSAEKFASGGSFNNKDELQSYFTRVNFSISDKYLLTASLRRDGSTRFGGSNTYGNFPSFAAKWRLIGEDFIPKNIFSDLGLRIGYGVTGNQEIPHNLYSARQRFNGWGLNNDGNLEGGGFGDVAFANPNLKWESTKQLNFGLDFGFANNRVSGSIDVYDKHTSDLLIRRTIPQPASNDFAWVNLDADVQNKGVELGLNVVAVDGKDFSWSVAGNIAKNKNLVARFSDIINTGEINGQGLTGAFAQRIQEGHPLFAFFVRDFQGYDDKGFAKYGVNNDKDFQQFLGQSPLPTVTAGLTNSISYKGFDATIFFNGVFGNYIYNNTANAYFTKGSLNGSRNVATSVVASKENPLNAPDVSTAFLEKGNFIRLQNLSLGYNLPIQNKMVKGLRVFLSGQNLMTITKYTGQDPEVNTNKSLNGVPSFGIDYSAYPRTRTWTLGVNITFN